MIPVGPSVIVVSGGVVSDVETSTVKDVVAGVESMFPAASFDLTLKVY